MRRSHALSSWIFLRALGLVYLIAWVSFWVQMEGLVGTGGIAPAAGTVRAFADHPELGFGDLPSLAWLGASTPALHALCGGGVLCAVLLMVGAVPGPALLGCWVTYLSIVTIGRPFMAFQWDALLLETGFVALLIAPWTGWSSPRGTREPAPIGRWLLYLVLFKVMFSSGVVKLASGDPAWRDLTAMTYHYQTQPLPHVVSYWAHQVPHGVQVASAGAMLAVELLAPFLILFAGWPRRVAAAAFAGLMLLIGATGNYGFFNLLVVVLCIPLLDDATWWRLLPGPVRARLAAPGGRAKARPGPVARRVVAVMGAAVLILSGGQLLITVLRPDLPAEARSVVRQVGAFHTFNRYGLFAVMTKRRPEIILEGSRDGRHWEPYPFEFKPGDPGERPRFAGLHMPRLDWQLWFAALGNLRGNSWVLGLMEGLLRGEPAVLELLDEERNPFPGEPPRYLRAVRYDYRFSEPAVLERTGRWWVRRREGLYAPVLSREALAGSHPPTGPRAGQL